MLFHKKMEKKSSRRKYHNVMPLKNITIFEEKEPNRKQQQQ